MRTSTKTGNIRKGQRETTELNNTITQLKNTLEAFSKRLNEAKQFCDLEDGTVELTQTVAKRKKDLKSEDSLRDL